MASPSTPHAGETTTICAAILLAAGAGTRFKGTDHKLLAKLDNSDESAGLTIFQQALAHVREARIGPVIVVTGAIGDLLSAVSSSEELGDVVVCHGLSGRQGL